MIKAPAQSRSEPPVRCVGWREVVELPDLDIKKLRAKIDSGARTSAIHAENQEIFYRDDVKWVRFSFPSPDSKGRKILEAVVSDERKIKNTGGVPEQRVIIRTNLMVGSYRAKVDISLADRKNMEFDLILGRTALRVLRLMINPSRSFLMGDPVSKVTQKHAVNQ
ncbi:ATP-dependent zinc protease family protein [Ahrensia kielensis]|uniref:RimK/LysX family protein n=1 Tax=Ahrensia kielensis TaxID=76980 RepID=A0ABU9T4Z9_9HYPH|nr:RimK/LysX family protein [Ahrensia kielensis]